MADQPPCALCGEAVDEDSGDVSPTMIGTPDGMRMAHRTCMLREVIGGIGHLIAHDYWCTQRHDPDATLTYRQSALLVDVYCAVIGIEPVGGDRRTPWLREVEPDRWDISDRD